MADNNSGFFANPVVKWIEYRLPVFSTLDHMVGTQYPTPKNLNYWWNFGSLAGLCLVIQIVTGIVLVMHYTPHTLMAFDSVEHIMRDVNYGWLLRYMHANGASMFFIVVYIHIFRGLYFGSYKAPREILWFLGLIIFLLMMATAFMGYVLPWGQMSFWGATVITNLFSAIPVVGEPIVTWLWGGFAVDNPTLNRFFSLHYLLPFVIVGVVLLHILALHQHGSNNPLGIDTKGPQDRIPFHPYYTIKDAVGVGAFLIFFCFFLFYAPNFLGHPDNYIPANPLVTPAHIVPEWYFLPFYAILRSVPDKLGGVLLMFGAILILFLLPWLDTSKVRSAKFRPIYKQLFWVFLIACVGLTYAGGLPPEGLALVIGRVCTVYYFAHFLILMPLVGWFEKPLKLPASISEAVLKTEPGAAGSKA
ncbi:cytochrome b/b6 [Ferrovibrio sp.]|uniref:cytochrome b n=1 Tax=Ferrovibrio sp. TaxID=1917215 RepID=UPI000CB0FCDF|nr:cytochrome b/b6 [Ferrovibrio sp.]PJI37972.1 MAG: cytochrome b [Ferrovibrio sp.]